MYFFNGCIRYNSQGGMNKLQKSVYSDYSTLLYDFQYKRQSNSFVCEPNISVQYELRKSNKISVSENHSN